MSLIDGARERGRASSLGRSAPPALLLILLEIRSVRHRAGTTFKEPSVRLVQARPRVARGRMVRRSGLALISASLALCAAGCQLLGTSSGQAPGQVPGGQQITVAVVPGFENAPLQVGVKNGLFAQRGLNVTVQTY